MAETQANVYMKLRQANPDTAEKEILRTMFVQRAEIALATGSKELFYQMVTDRSWVDSVVKSNPDLLSMTIYIILCEHPELRSQDHRLATALLSAGLTQDDIFREVMTTVANVLDEHAPIWRAHYAVGLDQVDGQVAKPIIKTQDDPGGQFKVPPLSRPHAPEADAMRHYNEGVGLINSGGREAAIEQFDRALAQSPDFEEAWFNKGNVLHGVGRHEEAILCYDHAPGLFQAWCNKGQALRALGRHEAALTSYEHALRMKPDDKITWLNRGVVLSKLQRNQEALVSFDRALALDHRYADAWVNKAGLLGQLKCYDEAGECFDRGLALNPSDFLGWYSKGNVLSDQMRWSEAVACYDRALAINGKLDQAWVEKGLCLGRFEHHEDALQCFNMALTLNPENRYAWLNKGVAMVVRFQNYREGLICFQQAQRLGHPDAASMISSCRQKMDSGQSL
jgi:tetratricopeptide (TPR) repeat protein